MAGKKPFTLILKDPMANSWIHSPYAPSPDPRLKITRYTRTTEEDDELGLLDMKVDDYENENGGSGSGSAAAEKAAPSEEKKEDAPER